MARSVKKGPFVDGHLAKKVEVALAKNDKSRSRPGRVARLVTPDFVGLTIAVHNGKAHVPVYVSDQMVGHKAQRIRAHARLQGHPADKKSRRNKGRSCKL